MRIPKDITLTQYIRDLERKHEIWKFYKTDDWKELREEVLKDFHGECQMCLAKGEVKDATCVHHVNHVRVKPELCLSKTFIDEEGKEQIQLLPLCDSCHDKVHPEKLKKKKPTGFMNKERW